MRNACDSDSRCGLACDASSRDAKSLAMRLERCEPLSVTPCFGIPGGRCPLILLGLLHRHFRGAAAHLCLGLLRQRSEEMPPNQDPHPDPPKLLNAAKITTKNLFTIIMFRGNLLIRVARLQSEFCTKDFCSSYEFSYEKCS